MSQRAHPDENLSAGDDPPRDPPASVIFTEMMRRAASDQAESEVPAPEAPAEPAAPDDEESSRPERPAMTPEQRRHAAALEAQRLQRVQKRRKKRQQKRAGVMGGIFLTWFIVAVAGGLIATILSWGTSPESFSPGLRQEMGRITAPRGGLQPAAGIPIAQPTAVPTPNYAVRIGVLSGHLGPENDPGAICDDGLTETEVNFAVAERVWAQLRSRGYAVDLLEEFDTRLQDYRATLFISIHANDCRPYAGGASGFLVAKADNRPTDGADLRLETCVGVSYERITGLTWRRDGLTRDMLDYHAFRRIHNDTPGVIIEMGFMRDDREILTEQPDLLARAIIAGIDCFLQDDPLLDGDDDETEAPVILPETEDNPEDVGIVTTEEDETTP